MNVNYKKLIMGLLLLVQFPAAIANSGNTLYASNSHTKIGYKQCSVKLSDDNNVEVSFQTQDILNFMKGGILSIVSAAYALNENGIKVDPDYLEKKLVKTSPNRVFLSLYFYHADGTRDLTIQLNEISNISLNGIIPSSSKENTQEIQFDHQLFLRDNYNISFKIPANKMNNISIAATVGGEVSYKGQSYSLLSSEGISFSSDGKSCETFNPQADIAPEALKIDPKFRMDSAVWQLKMIDLDELLDKTANNHGLPAELIHPNNNRFCLDYRSIATRNTRYMISADNHNGLASNNQLYQLQEEEGNNFINYKVKLNNSENAGADFELPQGKKYIHLRSDNNQMRSGMCWTPKIELFSTETTNKGSYSDTLNFTITPLA